MVLVDSLRSSSPLGTTRLDSANRGPCARFSQETTGLRLGWIKNRFGCCCVRILPGAHLSLSHVHVLSQALLWRSWHCHLNVKSNSSHQDRVDAEGLDFNSNYGGSCEFLLERMICPGPSATTQRAQHGLIEEHTLNHIRVTLTSKVYSLIKVYWALGKANPRVDLGRETSTKVEASELGRGL